MVRLCKWAMTSWQLLSIHSLCKGPVEELVSASVAPLRSRKTKGRHWFQLTMVLVRKSDKGGTKGARAAPSGDLHI